MDNTYTFDEQTDMLLALGFCEGNCRRSVREYHGRYPNRRTPNHHTFKNIERRLRENGMLKVNRRNAGRPRQARTILVEEEILELVDENPDTSVRLLERQNLHENPINWKLSRNEQAFTPLSPSSAFLNTIVLRYGAFN
ncbi:hypothetical protein NQ318_002551 [Aromia moschata]|uniref:DUF4817 domain-containing protein n=1 Tax=Aromia moschata TaxID=1265417 RepID=A0AAV8XTE9_9CUCU|nr:hypothetical protein NQ318_002551 [Aromia moschata]